MSDSGELLHQGIDALWDTARSLGTDHRAHTELAKLVDIITEAEAQLAGLRLHLIDEARLAGADNVLAGLRQSVRTTASQATAAVKLSSDLADRFPLIADALRAGQISLAQTEAIISGLRKLPPHLTRADLARCQESVLEHTDTLGPTELRHLAARLFEIVDPDAADADEARRLAAEERAAHRSRYLKLVPDHHGSIRITGQLPVAAAAQLTAQLDALMPPASSYRDTAELPTRDMRRADALILLCQAAATSENIPPPHRGRPTVHVTVGLDTLITGLGQAGIFSADLLADITAGEARRLACDAHILPIVLDGTSQPLDVGREKRLFTAAMIAALMERDQGCAFPGCNTTPTLCDAHHIVAWWAWGPTCITNGVLLCPHHHRLVEPDPNQSKQSQWLCHLDPVTGLPWFTPPRHVDPARKPRQHARYLLRNLKHTTGTKAPPCPPPTSLTSTSSAQATRPCETARRRPTPELAGHSGLGTSPAWTEGA